MTTTTELGNCDLTILARLIQPGKNLPLTAARALLKINFESSDLDRMKTLAEKARAGILTAAEQTEINDYERVGHLLSLLHTKARQSLKQREASGKSI